MRPKPQVDDLISKLSAARIVLQSRKDEEFMAYREVPEDEREFILPDENDTQLSLFAHRTMTVGSGVSDVEGDASAEADRINDLRSFRRDLPDYDGVTSYDGLARIDVLQLPNYEEGLNSWHWHNVNVRCT